jgi:hypothetical protein
VEEAVRVCPSALVTLAPPTSSGLLTPSSSPPLVSLMAARVGLVDEDLEELSIGLAVLNGQNIGIESGNGVDPGRRARSP